MRTGSWRALNSANCEQTEVLHKAATLVKLVIFIDSLVCGGAERVAANLANYWSGRGWEITLVTTASQASDFYMLEPAVNRIALGLESDNSNSFLNVLARSLRRARAFRRVLRQVRPQVALAMMTTTNVILAFAALGLTDVVTIGSEHSYPPRIPLQPLWERTRRIAYGWLSAVTALTSESAAWLKSHTRAVYVPVIPNATGWPLAIQDPVLEPGGLLTADRRVVLAAGRLADEKQFDHLIEAFAALAAHQPDWVLIILGDGPLRRTLDSQIKAHQLQHRVLLPGRVGNIGSWYERADLYVMTSRFEGFPSTLAEAMAYGLPAISYDCDTGPRDLIRNAVDGLLVPPGDIAALTSALARLMSEDALRRSYAGRALEVRERYSMERVTQMWERLFEQLQTK